MALPSNFETLYMSIANDYADIYNSLDEVAGKALAAVNEIVDLQSTSLDLSGDPQGRQVELLLLGKFNQAYTASTTIKSSTVTILDAVRAINNYVISNYGDAVGLPESAIDGDVTYTESISDNKLKEFINSVNVFNGECPIGWKELSTEAGYVTYFWDTASA